MFEVTKKLLVSTVFFPDYETEQESLLKLSRLHTLALREQFDLLYAVLKDSKVSSPPDDHQPFSVLEAK